MDELWMYPRSSSKVLLVPVGGWGGWGSDECTIDKWKFCMLVNISAMSQICQNKVWDRTRRKSFRCEGSHLSEIPGLLREYGEGWVLWILILVGMLIGETSLQVSKNGFEFYKVGLKNKKYTYKKKTVSESKV